MDTTLDIIRNVYKIYEYQSDAFSTFTLSKIRVVNITVKHCIKHKFKYCNKLYKIIIGDKLVMRNDHRRRDFCLTR